MDFDTFLTSPASRGLTSGMVGDASPASFGEEFDMPGMLLASPPWCAAALGPPDSMGAQPNLPLPAVPATRPSMPPRSMSEFASAAKRQPVVPDGAAPETASTAGHDPIFATLMTGKRDVGQMSFGRLAEDTCTCLDMMMCLLEAMGDEEVCHTSTLIPESEVDVVLVYLDRGSHTFGSVLSCERCNACSDNGMLIVSIAQRLFDATERAVPSVTAVYHEQLGDPQTQKTLGGTITLGRLKVVTPAISRQLFQQAVLAYVIGFQRCIQRMIEVIGEHKGVGKLLKEVGARTAKVVDSLERLGHNV